MKGKSIIITLTLLLLNTYVFSQNPQPQQDPMGQFLFPPELIMQNQQTLALSDTQRQAILEELKTAQEEFTSLQWGLESEMENLQTILKEVKVAESAAVDQMEKILTIENRIKKRQILLMIRIKNQLSEEQQLALAEIKQRQR